MTISLRKEQSIFALDLVHFLLWASEQGYEYTIGEVQRPVEMQQIYKKTGRSKTMNSMHLKKCAADIFFFKDGKLLASKEEVQPLGSQWEAMRASNSWGGNWSSFKDVPHFERKVR
jgi:peptidoglycan L-alanyl-D-glutamate endopeptidase CwlK